MIYESWRGLRKLSEVTAAFVINFIFSWISAFPLLESPTDGAETF